jgi:glycosidase
MNGPSWLNSAVIYQVYPQSFKDSNGDGIGDLNGITSKLDYIKSLGADAIWINPCFASPFGDAGYDVSDFYKVAPRYGTNKDLKHLCTAAAKKGIRVILDLVAGHTSIEHPWFKASCLHARNKYSNWYVWTDSVWHWTDDSVRTVLGYSQRNGNYAINYFWFQPALNYGFADPDPKKKWQLPVDHPAAMAVRKKMKQIMRFWMEMGASGFRVDCASSLVKGDIHGEHTCAFWREIRRWFDREYPDAVLIAEWYYPCDAVEGGFHIDFIANGKHESPEAYSALFRKEIQRSIVGCGGHSFFDCLGKGNIREFLDDYLEHYNKCKNRAHITIYSGTHDFPRISLNRKQRDLELIYAFLFTMPGVPFMYYGDEIGMRYCHLPSHEGGYHRTGARTPMQWNNKKNAGFSSASTDKLYLPIDPKRDRPNVEDQLANPASLLNKIKNLIILRKAHPELLAEAEFIPVYAQKNRYPFVYLRVHNKKRILVALNPSNISVHAAFNLAESLHFSRMLMSRGSVRIEIKKARHIIKMGPVSYGIIKID